MTELLLVASIVIIAMLAFFMGEYKEKYRQSKDASEKQTNTISSAKKARNDVKRNDTEFKRLYNKYRR